MDHITDLPECEGYDCILVVVCRLTKQAVFISQDGRCEGFSTAVYHQRVLKARVAD
jgi:hypothetical protein